MPNMNFFFFFFDLKGLSLMNFVLDLRLNSKIMDLMNFSDFWIKVGDKFLGLDDDVGD